MIEIIPAIDIIEGKCVRLTRGDYDTKKVYDDDPVETAKRFEAHGITRLHVVDLDGAKSKHVVNHKVIERIADHTSLVIDFGGGIKTDSDVDKAFASGASLITVGSVAVQNPTLLDTWMAKYGPQKIILGADVKNGYISINGWKEEANEQLMPFIDRYVAKGIETVLTTDISKDGMMQGPSTDLYRHIMAAHPTLHLIASGGVSSMADIAELDAAGIPAVVCGKAIYEGKIKLEDLAQYVS